MTMTAPVFHTDRLVLRAPQPSDVGPWTAFVTSERARFIGGPAEDANRAWRIFATIAGHWALRGWGSFVFCDRATGRPVGHCGPWQPEGWPEPEIAWCVWDPAAEGRGLAFEAARAAIAHAFRDLRWPTAVSYVEPGNARSIRLAGRLGALREEAAPRIAPGDLVFRHPRPAEAAA